MEYDMKEFIMGILKAKELAQYISEYYKEHTGKDISPVRLQKTLYFCFAYWGGFILKGKRYQGETTEIDVSKYSEYCEIGFRGEKLFYDTFPRTKQEAVNRSENTCNQNHNRET